MRILDVGCGTGSLLFALADLGFSRLLGIDPFISADIEHESRGRILKETIHDVEGEFDVIMFHHAFEHLPDPGPTLNAVYRLLAPGGRCVIRIPTVSSYAWEHYGANWVALDAPRHFFLHSVESMNLLAKNSGLELNDVVYDSAGFQFWGSEQYAHDIPIFDTRSHRQSPKNSMFSKGEIAAFEKRAAQLNEVNRGDSAAFYLRKSLL
jgi:SAM-dependent methyltransferase